MTILVTGGAGFIGSHLVEHFLEVGVKVLALDNFDTFYDPMLKRANLSHAATHGNFTLVEGDIRNESLLLQVFSRYPIDTVVHIAARVGVRPSIRNPQLYYDVNVNGTLRVLEAMRVHGVKKLIFASSSSVYGNSTKVPFSETDGVDNPISPYAATKKACELLCHTYHYLHGFDIFALRFFTVYGPRQRPEMAIHQFVKKILSGQPITVYGDGTSRRDYTFVDDVIQGVLHAVDRVRGFEIINLGESRTISLLDLIAVIEEEAGKKAIIDWQPAQAGDVHQTYADITKAKSLLGYAPAFGIREGIHEFCKWYSSSAAVP